ncbi:MAG: DUF2867 domain-containing protein [Pseudodesulfovibrio sp.]|uniref:DUF2867 domain-containing protein n=1 Tax=Pseudodesulfovibrio sp. TaxID=2035812 RepID=UPI003D0B5034
MSLPDTLSLVPVLAEHMAAVDYLHVKTVESPQTLREFAAACLSYMPGWMRYLYRVRGWFVRLLGTRQEEVPCKKDIAPEQLLFRPGDMGAFFTVLDGEEERFWIGEARDGMIAGHLAFVREPGPDGLNRFHLVTAATYLRWQARIYFTVIRPFHHLVVHTMARHALAEAKRRGA